MLDAASDTLIRSLASASLIIHSINQFDADKSFLPPLINDVDTPYTLFMLGQRSYAASALVVDRIDDVLDIFQPLQ